jgi:hypothetical protein
VHRIAPLSLSSNEVFARSTMAFSSAETSATIVEPRTALMGEG